MALSYYAEYVSSTVGTTGCVKGFVTPPQDHVRFPPQVSYQCDLCKGATHGFRLRSTHLVGTPSQQRSFDAHCENNHLERDVEVPMK